MEAFTRKATLLGNEYELKALDYETYKHKVTALLADNKVTGLIQSKSLVGYTRLNVYRMHRIEKKIQILPEVKSHTISIQKEISSLLAGTHTE